MSSCQKMKRTKICHGVVWHQRISLTTRRNYSYSSVWWRNAEMMNDFAKPVLNLCLCLSDAARCRVLSHHRGANSLGNEQRAAESGSSSDWKTDAPCPSGAAYVIKGTVRRCIPCIYICTLFGLSGGIFLNSLQMSRTWDKPLFWSRNEAMPELTKPIFSLSIVAVPLKWSFKVTFDSISKVYYVTNLPEFNILRPQPLGSRWTLVSCTFRLKEPVFRPIIIFASNHLPGRQLTNGYARC